MIKTAYQIPELRNANDEVVQEGAFGKNTALSNSTNDGWIDYVMNDLEALHDTIGDSSPTLDGNGHVVEPANYAIGDEDGLRIKTGYLKLTGGTVSGTLNVAQNLKFQDNQENVFGGVYVPSSSATEQYAQFYGGEGTGVAGAKLTLYPDGDGRFKLDARSTDGANTYTLVTDNNGNLNWRGYPLAWKKDYLPLAGGVMTGNVRWNMPNAETRLFRADETGKLALYGGVNWSTSANLYLCGNASNLPGQFSLVANDGTNSTTLEGKPDGTLKWGGKSVFRGTSNINSGNGLGSEKNEANNTVKQWTRVNANAGESVTWTFNYAMANSYYYSSAVAENGNNVSITSRTTTALTVKNNGSTYSAVDILVIGTPASQ